MPMKKFTSVHDISNLQQFVQEAMEVKFNPRGSAHLGEGKTLSLLFMNPSLRTRMSTQRAAFNLGMDVMVLNLDKDSWQLEFQDGAIMNQGKAEHIREAARAIDQYSDIVGLRCFPGLVDREEDYSEMILNSFLLHCNKPLVSMESATRHPLQSFADVITIAENHHRPQPPRVVLSWAPHVRALPQAVPNSFAEWAVKYGADVVIAHPLGYELSSEFTHGATIEHDQQKALDGADFVYVKNWSSFEDYGAQPEVEANWLLSKDRLSITNKAKVMHCLPVRRNVELSDDILDDPCSIVQEQAGNRVVAAQTILKRMLEAM